MAGLEREAVDFNFANFVSSTFPKVEVGSLLFQPATYKPGINQAYIAKPLVVIVCPSRGPVATIINEARKFCHRAMSLTVLEKMEFVKDWF